MTDTTTFWLYVLCAVAFFGAIAALAVDWFCKKYLADDEEQE